MSNQKNVLLNTNKKVTAGVASVLLGTAVLMGGTTVHADTATPASAAQPVAAVSTSAANSASASNATQSSTANSASASDNAVTAVVPAPSADQVTNSAIAAANITKVEWANPEQVNKDAQTEGSYVEDLVITWKDGSVSNVKWNLFVKGTTTAKVPAPSASEVTKDPEAAKNIKSVEWADPAKVNQDIQKPGEYVEHLVITWNDGTTTTVKWNLIVKGADNDDNNGDNNNNGNNNNNNNGDNNSSNDNNGNNTNNGNNNAVNGNHNNGAAGTSTVINKGNGQVSIVNGSVAGNVVKNSSANSNALPQTGNKNTSAVVALGAVAAMFGLGLAAKKREF